MILIILINIIQQFFGYQTEGKYHELKGMVPEQLKKMFGLKDTKDMKMANNIWKMLDEMAESNPDNYKQFVQKNLNEGFHQIKQKRQQKLKSYKFKPNIGFKLQMDANLSEEVLQNDLPQKVRIGTNIHQKLNFSAPKWQEMVSKFQKSIRVHLNICHSERVRLPTLKGSHKQIKDITINQLKQIQNLYYSIQGPYQDSPKQYYYMLVINSHTYQNVTRQGGKKILISLALSYLQERIKADKNPLKGKFDPISSGKNAFYKIEGMTVEVSPTKFQWGKSKQPQQILLQKQIDVKRIEQAKASQNSSKNKASDEKKQQNINKSQQKSIKKQFKEDRSKQPQKKLDIKFKREQVPQQTQLPSLIPKAEQQRKKVIIQVLSETVIQDSKQPQMKQEQIQFEMYQTETGYHFQFFVPGVLSIAELNLQVCKNVIRLSTHDGKKIQMNLLRPINEQKVKAKMKKKISKLVVDTFFHQQ